MEAYYILFYSKQSSPFIRPSAKPCQSRSQLIADTVAVTLGRQLLCFQNVSVTKCDSRTSGHGRFYPRCASTIMSHPSSQRVHDSRVASSGSTGCSRVQNGTSTTAKATAKTAAETAEGESESQSVHDYDGWAATVGDSKFLERIGVNFQLS